jgi:UDP:flavonoid glycosyltransferase YjiC (YdhE family)
LPTSINGRAANGRGGLVVYVTSHGFGHLNRAAAVINRLTPEVPVAIRSHPDLHDYWRERLRRPATLGAYVSDVGALSPPGESQATDMAATLALAARVHAEAMERVDAEAQALRDEGAAAVLSDAPAVPLVAARRAGIPGFLLANFTWADIYAPHARRLGEDANRLVAELRAAYRQATLIFRAEPALRMTGSAPVTDVGMVVTPGHDRGPQLRRELGLAAGDRLVYCYFGRYGQANLGYDRLERMGTRGIHFVGFHPAPTGPLANLHVVAASDWTGADLAASCDAMVVKAGYGTACEAMTSGTPIIYPPRTGFAEHRALDRALREWGGGVPVSARAFEELRIERLLDHAFALKPGPAPFHADGASRVAERLALTCGAMSR